MNKHIPKHKTLNSPLQKFLVEYLKNARQSQGLSMRAIVKELAIPHTIVGKIENMERRLDVIEFIDYCYAMHLNPSDVLNIILLEREKLISEHE